MNTDAPRRQIQPLHQFLNNNRHQQLAQKQANFSQQTQVSLDNLKIPVNITTLANPTFSYHSLVQNTQINPIDQSVMHTQQLVALPNNSLSYTFNSADSGSRPSLPNTTSIVSALEASRATSLLNLPRQLPQHQQQSSQQVPSEVPSTQMAAQATLPPVTKLIPNANLYRRKSTNSVVSSGSQSKSAYGLVVRRTALESGGVRWSRQVIGKRLKDRGQENSGRRREADEQAPQSSRQGAPSDRGPLTPYKNIEKQHSVDRVDEVDERMWSLQNSKNMKVESGVMTLNTRSPQKQGSPSSSERFDPDHSYSSPIQLKKEFKLHLKHATPGIAADVRYNKQPISRMIPLANGKDQQLLLKPMKQQTNQYANSDVAALRIINQRDLNMAQKQEQRTEGQPEQPKSFLRQSQTYNDQIKAANQQGSNEQLASRKTGQVIHNVSVINQSANSRAAQKQQNTKKRSPTKEPLSIDSVEFQKKNRYKKLTRIHNSQHQPHHRNDSVTHRNVKELVSRRPSRSPQSNQSPSITFASRNDAPQRPDQGQVSGFKPQNYKLYRGRVLDHMPNQQNQPSQQRGRNTLAEQLTLTAQSFQRSYQDSEDRIDPMNSKNITKPTQNLMSSSANEYGQQTHIHQATQMTASQSLRHSMKSSSVSKNRRDLRDFDSQKQTPKTQLYDPQISQVVSHRAMENPSFASAERRTDQTRKQFIAGDQLHLPTPPQYSQDNEQTNSNKNRIIIEMKEYMPSQSAAQVPSAQIGKQSSGAYELNQTLFTAVDGQQMNTMNGIINQIKMASIDEKPSTGSARVKRESEFNSIKLESIYDKKQPSKHKTKVTGMQKLMPSSRNVDSSKQSYQIVTHSSQHPLSSTQIRQDTLFQPTPAHMHQTPAPQIVGAINPNMGQASNQNQNLSSTRFSRQRSKLKGIAEVKAHAVMEAELSDIVDKTNGTGLRYDLLILGTTRLEENDHGGKSVRVKQKDQQLIEAKDGGEQTKESGQIGVSRNQHTEPSATHVITSYTHQLSSRGDNYRDTLKIKTLDKDENQGQLHQSNTSSLGFLNADINQFRTKVTSSAKAVDPQRNVETPPYNFINQKKSRKKQVGADSDQAYQSILQ